MSEIKQNDLRETHKAQGDRLIEKIKRELGREFLEALQDPNVTELQLNPDKKVFVVERGQVPREIGTMDAYSSHALIGSVAHALCTVVTPENPIVEGEFPLDGSRFEGLIPPVVANPIFTIRKKAISIFTLDDYVAKGSMTSTQRSAIHKAIIDRKNILVVGGTNSGKTTLVNAIINAISNLCPDDRLVIIEDTAELQCSAKNAVLLRSTEKVSAGRLLKATLRLTPDRIVFGEVRGGEALELLKSWNTGHPGGCCTIHANSAYEGLSRLQEAIAEVTEADMRNLISSAVNVTIFIEKNEDQKRVLKEILEITGHRDGKYITLPVVNNTSVVQIATHRGSTQQ